MEEYVESEIFYRFRNISDKKEERIIREKISKWASSTSGQLLENLGEIISFKELINLPSYKITLLTQIETRFIDLEYLPADRITIMNHPDRDKTNLSIDVWKYDFPISPDFGDKIYSKRVEGSDKLEVCPKCNGDGKKSCTECYGRGEKNCNYCGGKGEMSCSSCNGRGETECHSCRGRGEIKCYNCKGKGYYIPLLSDHEERCSVCGTRGFIPCQECSNGFIRCRSCSGSGRIRCDVCHSKGIIRCTNCNGKGEVECRNCDGTGYINSFLYVKDQLFKLDMTITIYDNPNSDLIKYIDTASSEIVFQTEVDGFLELKNVNIEEPIIKTTSLELMKNVSDQYESIKHNSKILRQKLFISKIDNVFARYEYKEKIYDLNIICDIVYASVSPVDYMLESMYEEAKLSYRKKNLNDAIKTINKLYELKHSKELENKLILLKNKCNRRNSNYILSGALFGVLSSIILYYLVFAENVNNIYEYQPNRIYAFLTIIFVVCCFIGYVVAIKINIKKKILLGFFISFSISFLMTVPLCYYFMKTDENMSNKRMNSVINNYSSNLIGKWIGQISGAGLLVDIESQNGNNFEGINTVQWKKKKVTRKISGSIDGNKIVLNEPGTDKGDGRFSGIVSLDGRSINGTWKRFSNGEEKKWSVSKR